MGFVKGLLFIAFIILGLIAACSTRGRSRPRVVAFLVCALVLAFGG